MKRYLIGTLVLVLVALIVGAADITQTATYTTKRPPITNEKFYTKTADFAYASANTDLPALYTAVNAVDQLAGIEIQTASITAPNQALVTNAFATVFTAAPVVTATYTENPGDVRPIFVSAVTASNVIFGITADMNYAYTAIYKP